MSKIDAYHKSVDDWRCAEQWIALIGKEYRGGGGGIGEVRSIYVKSTVYSQAYDGATNYHDIPGGLAEALSGVVRVEMDRLIRLALDAMVARSKTLAAEAAKEHSELMAAAGLTP